MCVCVCVCECVCECVCVCVCMCVCVCNVSPCLLTSDVYTAYGGDTLVKGNTSTLFSTSLPYCLQ